MAAPADSDRRSVFGGFMSDGKSRFRHDSLQDQQSIGGILDALATGFAQGKLTFKEEDGELIIEPQGLLELKVVANDDEDRHSLNIRISWQVERQQPTRKTLSVS